MHAILGRYSEEIYALVRIVVGFLFSCHGAQKLFGVLGGEPQPFGSLLWFGGIIEFFGGLLVLVGLLTSWAAFLSSGMMAVAYFMAHQPKGALPIQNDGELAAAYAWIFLYIASRGAGGWSIARALEKDSLG
jgi:putative oxidoreductase